MWQNARLGKRLLGSVFRLWWTLFGQSLVVQRACAPIGSPQLVKAPKSVADNPGGKVALTPGTHTLRLLCSASASLICCVLLLLFTRSFTLKIPSISKCLMSLYMMHLIHVEFRQKTEPGIEPPTLWLIDDPLYLVSHIRQLHKSSYYKLIKFVKASHLLLLTSLYLKFVFDIWSSVPVRTLQVCLHSRLVRRAPCCYKVSQSPWSI